MASIELKNAEKWFGHDQVIKGINLTIKKGEFVTLHFKNKTMSLSTRGVSVEPGSRNQGIRVKNRRSKRIIEARVLGPNIAVVLPTTTILR